MLLLIYLHLFSLEKTNQSNFLNRSSNFYDLLTPRCRKTMKATREDHMTTTLKDFTHRHRTQEFDSRLTRQVEVKHVKLFH